MEHVQRLIKTFYLFKLSFTMAIFAEAVFDIYVQRILTCEAVVVIVVVATTVVFS